MHKTALMERIEEEYNVEFCPGEEGVSRIAYAWPPENKIFLQDTLYSEEYQDMFENVVLHELGHILDYRERGKASFFKDVFVGAYQKKKIEKEKRNGSMSESRYIRKYYAIGLEKRANSFFNLSYEDFIR